MADSGKGGTLEPNVLEGVVRMGSEEEERERQHRHHHHHERGSRSEDKDYSEGAAGSSSSSSSSAEEEVSDKEEEEEEEEDEGEEDMEEEEEEEEEEVKGKTQEEIEEELREMQTILINEYIEAKRTLRYEKKRNAYFQDRIYRTSVRKGIIIESELVEDASATHKKKKRRRHCRETLAPAEVIIESAEEDEDDEEYEGEGKDEAYTESNESVDREDEGMDSKKKSQEELVSGISQSEDFEGQDPEEEENESAERIEEEESDSFEKMMDDLEGSENEDDEEEEEEEEEEELQGKKKRRRRGHHKKVKDPESAFEKRGFLGEKFANEAKYQKLLRKILKLMQMKTYYLFQHNSILAVHAEKCREWSRLHENNMNKLLDEIRFQSDFAVDSNTGKRMQKHETEYYCAEISRIHRKLCDTMLKMYKSRRGLEFALKRLRESEIQEGEEIEILEYEQLLDENSSLKDKLGDRMKEVENIKAKISYAIQILAHVRSKMSNMTEDIWDGSETLTIINQEVLASKAKGEEILNRLLQKRAQERSLVVDSGLLDNPTLLRDFESTSDNVKARKEEKRHLERKITEGNREMQEIKERTAELRQQYPHMFERSVLPTQPLKTSSKVSCQRNRNQPELKYVCQK